MASAVLAILIQERALVRVLFSRTTYAPAMEFILTISMAAMFGRRYLSTLRTIRVARTPGSG